MIRRLAFIFLLFFFIFLCNASDFGEDVEGDFYTISRDKIERVVEKGEMFRDFIEITNKGKSSLDVSFLLSGTVTDIIDLENVSLKIAPGTTERAYFFIRGKEGEYSGDFRIGGSVVEDIPIFVNVTQGESGSYPFVLEVNPVKKIFDITKNITFQIVVKKIKSGVIENVSMNYTLLYENDSYSLGSEELNFSSSETLIRDFSIPEGVDVGDYFFVVYSNYNGIEVSDKDFFILERKFFDIVLFGIFPMWGIVTFFSLIMVGFLIFIIIKKKIASKKKYQMRLDLKTIPKKNKDFLFLGKIAETNHETYLDPNRLTTHSIVAGATGGGKSITAQVLVEECLLHDIAVVVFDPTAQWSGMLRKCTDKKMISYYSKFGMKPKDARGFKGNVRMVKNARQVINLNKYVTPGQIQIFSLNKLDPKDMDIFVASVIRQIFKSDPKEFPTLKVLLVFDEVHRLLPKFGGSGEGFLQIERGCREFRKWGLGIMLVSQVLNDFVGAIKANISSEAQMRTRDEGDLNRIKTKYGEEFLQSLVKASVGVGMFANPAYNHAQPYFIQFRPILHNTRRLTDEELEEYNKYNDMVDEIEFKIEELEKEKVDVFDMKMELKLVKDKIMTGSFSVVQIYLEGLGPRIEKEWSKLGKKCPERVIELISEEEIQKAIAEAKASHDKEAAKNAPAAGAAPAEKKVDLVEKIVNSVTFDNGAMISSLKEMTEYLPEMDSGDLKRAVGGDKNMIADWVKENFGDDAGKKMSGKKTKDDIIKVIGEIVGGDKKEGGEKKEGGSDDGEKEDGDKKKEEGEKSGDKKDDDGGSEKEGEDDKKDDDGGSEKKKGEDDSG